MYFRYALIAALSTMLLSCSKPPEMTLEKLLAQNAEARGGETAIENISSVEVELEIIEPEFTVTAHYRAARTGEMRIDVFADGTRVFTEALGPDDGWQMFADGKVADLSPEGRRALERGVVSNLYGLHELPELGYELEYLGVTQRGSGSFWELKKTAPDGFSEHLFFDKDTFLIASSVETSALHPDIDSTEVRQETFNIAHEETGGLLYPSKMETRNLETGDLMQSVTVTTRRVNTPLDAAQFKRPETE